MRQLSFLKIGAGGNLPEDTVTLGNLLADDWYAQLLNTVSQDHHFKSPTRIERYSPIDRWYGHLVEPHPYHLIELIRHMKRQYAACANYRIYQCAIHGASQILPFTIPGSNEELLTSINQCSGIYLEADYYQPHCEFYHVPAFSLQDFLREIACAPDYIHMNSEGSEKSIIENYDFKHKPDTWAIETHRGLSSPHTIGSILEQHGYETFYNENDPHTMVIAYRRS